MVRDNKTKFEKLTIPSLARAASNDYTKYNTFKTLLTIINNLRRVDSG